MVSKKDRDDAPEGLGLQSTNLAVNDRLDYASNDLELTTEREGSRHLRDKDSRFSSKRLRDNEMEPGRTSETNTAKRGR